MKLEGLTQVDRNRCNRIPRALLSRLIEDVLRLIRCATYEIFLRRSLIEEDESPEDWMMRQVSNARLSPKQSAYATLHSTDGQYSSKERMEALEILYPR